ncbi:hypothetical protein [Blastococcus sp. SYSU DS0539]
MTGLLVAAAVCPLLVLVLAFVIGRLLRSTDRIEERQRTADAASWPAPPQTPARPARRRLAPSVRAGGA